MLECQEKPQSLVNVYIDGFNLYHAIDALERNHLKWLDHTKLAKTFLRSGERIGKIYFFTAVVTWDQGKSQRHIAYLDALRALEVIVVESNFRKQPKHCFSRGVKCNFREEKKTDVAISVTMLGDAVHGKCHRQILITSDSDQVPTIEAVRRLSPQMKLTLFYPPRRSNAPTELGSLFSGAERFELKAGRLDRCLLPRDVLNTSGKKVATMPAAYAH